MTDESESDPTATDHGAPPPADGGTDAREADDPDADEEPVDGLADATSVSTDRDGNQPPDRDENRPFEREDGSADALGAAGVDRPSEIDPSELTVDRRSLNPKIRIIWVLRAVLTATIAGALAFLADSYLLEVGAVLPAGVALALLVLGVTHAILRYRIWSYEVREDALYLERGVVTRVRTVVPFVRIQHVDTSRGPIERATGLATSVVYTAGSRGADVTIPGLEADRADDLQHRLKRLAIASEADTAV